jgi:hypothetical protein
MGTQWITPAGALYYEADHPRDSRAGAGAETKEGRRQCQLPIAIAGR